MMDGLRILHSFPVSVKAISFANLCRVTERNDEHLRVTKCYSVQVRPHT
jgi:hypothetical protein